MVAEDLRTGSNSIPPTLNIMFHLGILIQTFIHVIDSRELA